jgi:hypothetical protein
LKQFITILIISLTILACSKGNHSSPRPIDNVLINEPAIAANELTDILNGSDIVVVSTIVDGFPMPISDCLKDNILRLRDDTTFTHIVGLKCEDSEVDIDGTWSVEVKDKHVKVIMMQNEGEDNFQVTSFSKSTLEVITNKEIDGSTYSVRIKFEISNTPLNFNFL